MPLHIIHRSSLYLACLRTSLNCLCFSWALCSANWILPLSKALSCFLPIVLARWDFSFPNDINFFLLHHNWSAKQHRMQPWQFPFFHATHAWDTCSMPMHQQTHLHSGCIQASIWWGVLAHSNDHRFSQGVPWKHYPGDVACLDKAIPFWTCTMTVFVPFLVWKFLGSDLADLLAANIIFANKGDFYSSRFFPSLRHNL